jgi:hypothetical protein
MPPAGRGNREMPTFFVIGAAKCGTTSVHSYLDLHPDISMARIKEPRYFCRHLPDFDLDLIADRQEYLSLFEPGTAARGESSTAYSMTGLYPGVPRSIRREIEDAKLIFLVRDPIERTRSAVQEVVSSRDPSLRDRFGGFDTSDEGDVWRLFEDLGDGPNQVIDPGLYETQLRAYLEVFPQESILVIDNDDLSEKTAETMGAIFLFLGLQPVPWSEPFGERRNAGSEKVRDSDLYMFLARSAILRRLLRYAPSTLTVTARRSFGRRVRKPDLDPRLRVRLEEIFRPEVEGLREITGLQFRKWSV